MFISLQLIALYVAVQRVQE